MSSDECFLFTGHHRCCASKASSSINRQSKVRRTTMKKLGAFAISIFVGALVPGVASLPAWGQGENPPARTKAVGQTSGHGVTAVEQGSPGNVEQQIRALHDQGRQAALKGDAGFFEGHMA